MESPPEPLTPTEHRRLIEIIGRQAPHLLALARDDVNTRWLTTAECAGLTCSCGPWAETMNRVEKGRRPTT